MMLTAKKFAIPAVTFALAFGFSALPGALAQDDAPPAAEQENGEKAKKKRGGCPFRRAIRGYSVIDDEHFVLDTGREFLVTLSPGCHNLDFGISIAIKSTPAAGICVERGDRVILSDGPMNFSCLIREIEPVENKEEAKKLVEERKKAEEEG